MPDTAKALSWIYDKGHVFLKGASQRRVAVMIEVIFLLVKDVPHSLTQHRYQSHSAVLCLETLIPLEKTAPRW